MDRSKLIQTLKNNTAYWDVLVIGGGATGLGVAVDASSRGYKTLLLEMHDFAKATSSRSTKLVHGGVRYLQQGDVSLVIEALHERGLLIQNAPHLVSNQAFIVPSYEWWNGPFYGVGMKVYDLLAGKLGLGPSKLLSREETMKLIPTLEPDGLRGGVIYYDGQFDDSRLAINLAQTVYDLGGIPINYIKVTDLLKSKNLIDGVKAQDMETGDSYDINARVVINATGIFADSIIQMDQPETPRLVQPAQGVHIVLDKDFLPGDSAIMVPHTDDGRVLFAVPWHDKVIVGTTDTPMKQAVLEPRPLDEEVSFILRHAAKYMSKDPTRSDVRSAFAGLRPLVKPPDAKSTSEISRSHHLQVSESGLVTIAGGKWTTYRKMGEDTVDQAAIVAGLNERECQTSNLRIHGWLKNVDRTNHLYVYGSDSVSIRKIIDEQPNYAEKIHDNLPYIKAEVVWAVRNEMARTVEDVLARRTRSLLLDARASIEMAPEVARLMADGLGRDEQWQTDQVNEYRELAQGYILT
ncbi:MAG TPA: glycerol-3-phosphate dehydrogenase/oxidase [Balneolales bacterium]|nr:glycerol-3-phosphate dehydrogenase/oxidase [Balneolales bacterium]